MKNLNNHWDNLYTNTDQNKLGWFEDNLSQTNKFLSLINLNDNANIFLPGAGTSELVDSLVQNNYNVIINDISIEALNNTYKRNIQYKNNLTIFNHNLSSVFPKDLQKSDLWLDRAVLHFLLTEDDIKIYFDNLKNNLNKNGYVLLAEFSDDGAISCAGLNIKRYTTDKFSYYLGDEFELIKDEKYTFINPNGDDRPYIYALYQRKLS